MKLTKDIIKKLIKENWESDVDDFNWWLNKSKEEETDSNSAQTARNQKIHDLSVKALTILSELIKHDVDTMNYQGSDNKSAYAFALWRLKSLWWKVKYFTIYATAEPLGMDVSEKDKKYYDTSADDSIGVTAWLHHRVIPTLKDQEEDKQDEDHDLF